MEDKVILNFGWIQAAAHFSDAINYRDYLNNLDVSFEYIRIYSVSISATDFNLLRLLDDYQYDYELDNYNNLTEWTVRLK